MAGITATSSTGSHIASTADASTSGFITGETVTLVTSPTGTVYSWSLSLPSGSSALRVGFAGETSASASFTPDVSGTYTATVNVDGTTYVLRISAANIAVTNTLEGVRLQPVTDAQVPTPSSGVTVYYSSTQSALCVKDAEGDVFEVDLTAV